MSAPVLAADVGGTQMRAALVGEDGAVLVRRTASTPRHAEVPAALVELVATVGHDRAHGTASHAVVGLPGSIDYDAGRLLWAPHLPPQWPELLSAERLSAALGLPVHVANDADLAAVGEAHLGAGAASPDVAYLTISTGIGAGVVHRGRLLRGRRSIAEIGHTIIDWEAWLEGSPSTLEELGSGSGLAARARQVGLGDVDAPQIQVAAAAGDRRARAIWDEAVGACAVGVANVLMAFSPSTVVVGGGLGRREDFFGRVRDLVLSRPEHHPDDLAIVPSALGDDAGLVGTARWLDALG